MDTIFYLLAMRQSLVVCTAMMMWPFETVFDVIDDELERRGVAEQVIYRLLNMSDTSVL